ncbi:MAG: Ig-like domain-containing protein [Methanobacterium sp.]
MKKQAIFLAFLALLMVLLASTVSAFSVTNTTPAIIEINGTVGLNTTPSRNATWSVSPVIGKLHPITNNTTTFTANASGVATISALYAGMINTTTVTVRPKRTGITIAGPANVTIGTTATFNASAIPGNASLGNVSWASSNTTVGTVAPAIGNTTIFTAHALGTTTITALTTPTGIAPTHSANITVTVIPVPTRIGITITPPTANVTVLRSLNFTATAIPAGAPPPPGAPTWSVTNLTVGTITPAGLFTATNVTGTTDVIALWGAYTARATVTVVPKLTGISVTPPTATVPVNGTLNFNATGLPPGAVLGNVTWTVSPAGRGNITAAGLFTAHTVGPATITATFGGISGTANVTVVPALTGITIAPLTPSVVVNGTLNFTAAATPANATLPPVIWAVTVPAVGTITPGGVFTALAPGTTLVTATGGNFTANTTVTVTPVPPPVLTGISVSPVTPTVIVNGTLNFDASPIPIGAPFGHVTWAVTPAVRGTITPAGLFTALTPGVANVTASFGNFTGTTTVTVVPPLTVTASPPGGNFNDTVTVSLASAGGSSNRTIFFTTDTTHPTTASPRYTVPLTFNTSTTLRFFVRDDLLGISSPVFSEDYNIYRLVPHTFTVRVPVTRHVRRRVRVRRRIRLVWRWVWVWRWVPIREYVTRTVTKHIRMRV